MKQKKIKVNRTQLFTYNVKANGSKIMNASENDPTTTIYTSTVTGVVR